MQYDAHASSFIFLNKDEPHYLRTRITTNTTVFIGILWPWPWAYRILKHVRDGPSDLLVFLLSVPAKLLVGPGHVWVIR